MAAATETPPVLFECSVCLDEKEQTEMWRLDEDNVCEDCIEASITPLFQAALHHEHNYPVRWGRVALNIKHFERILGEEFVSKFNKKVIEYETPTNKRVYCPCEQFLGIGPATPGKTVCCPKCEKLICCSCKGEVDDAAGHHCPGEKSEAAVDLGTQGVDYQVCPNPSCLMPIFRKDACNHLYCPSAICIKDDKYRVGFCFLCGKRTLHTRSSHFRRPGCPRWNNKGDANAGYDSGLFFVGEEDEDEEFLLNDEAFNEERPRHLRDEMEGTFLTDRELMLIPADLQATLRDIRRITFWAIRLGWEEVNWRPEAAIIMIMGGVLYESLIAHSLCLLERDVAAMPEVYRMVHETFKDCLELVHPQMWQFAPRLWPAVRQFILGHEEYLARLTAAWYDQEIDYTGVAELFDPGDSWDVVMEDV